MQNVIERVINLLIYLLETPRPVTADQIRRTVLGYSDQSDEAFRRMFERDKDLLRTLGVPLELRALDAWEVDFGYIVDPDKYAMVDPGLDDEERAALALASRMVRLGAGEPDMAGLLKLGGATRVAGNEPIGADLGADTEILAGLFGALTERRTVRFEYRGSNRRARPYGMGHHRGHWSLVGDTDDGLRMYRVDRIRDLIVEEQPGSYERPEDFDIKRVLLAQPWDAGDGGDLVATVHFDESVAWWAGRLLGRDAPPDGDLVVDIPVSNLDAFVGWILSFADHAEVTSPESVRLEIRKRVEAALETVI